MPRLLLGTDHGVLAIDDDGTVAAEHDAGPVTLLRRGADSRGTESWWAVASEHVVLRRTPDGAWSEIARLDDEDIRAFLPVTDGVLLGTRTGRMFRARGSELAPLAGFETVEGRDTWHAVGSPVPYVRSMSATADGTALLASVHVGGIPRSTDAGATWLPTIDPEADVHEVRADPQDPRLVLAAAAVGLCTSTDGGITWTVDNAGMHASYSRAVACTTDAVVVSASDGPFGSKCALYRRPLAGGLIERVQGGLPEWLAGIVDTGMLDARGSTVAFADPDGGVFASTDGAHSFTELTRVPPYVHAVAVR